MKKSLLALFMSLAMIVSLTACGGSGSSEPAAEAAEPNAGVAGIVFAVPEGWTAESIGPNFVNFRNPDSDFELSVNVLDEEGIAGMEGEDSKLSLQEYFDKYCVPTDELAKKNDYEWETVKICDTDAYSVKHNHKDTGCYSMSADWMYDNSIYNVYIFNQDNFDENGIKDDIVAVGSAEEQAFTGLLASVQPGDGAAMMSQKLKADSVGDYSFTAPEGYTLTEMGSDYVSFEKGEATLRFSRTTEEDFQSWGWEGDDVPGSLEEMYKQQSEGMYAATVAGVDGYIGKYPDEDGKFYNVNAGFMADGVFYEVTMDTNAYDEDGLKADAVALTDEDIAAFDAFVASLAKK